MSAGWFWAFEEDLGHRSLEFRLLLLKVKERTREGTQGTVQGHGMLEVLDNVVPHRLLRNGQ